MKTALSLLGRCYSAQLTGYVILSDGQLEDFAKRAREEMREAVARLVETTELVRKDAVADAIRALPVEAKP